MVLGPGGKSTNFQVLFPMIESISSFIASFQNPESTDLIALL